MKRDDAHLMEAAEQLANEHGLSAREFELLGGGGPQPKQADRERVEDLLYEHLFTARQRAFELDRLEAWGPDYVNKNREREHALARASEHYRQILAWGGQLTPLLAEMVLSEGLTP